MQQLHWCHDSNQKKDQFWKKKNIHVVSPWAQERTFQLIKYFQPIYSLLQMH